MRLARAHGLANVLGGLWPLLHMRSFETVTGPKVDRWLVRTVGGLMVTVGWVQLSSPPSPEGRTTARRLGVGTAATLAAIDVRYAVSGRISPVYLLDALLEAGWLVAWAVPRGGPQFRRAAPGGGRSR